MDIYVDGSGKGKCGFVADNTTRFVGKGTLTNNQAEYIAVIKALEWVNERDVTILSDSQVIVNQLSHNWHIKNDRLRELAVKVWDLIDRKRLKVEFKWIPREQNKAGKLLG